MFWILLFLILVISLIIWLMMAPILLKINSLTDTYSIEWRGIGNLRIISEMDDIKIVFRLFFWKKDISLIKGDWKYWRKKEKTKKTTSKRKHSIFKMSRSRLFKLLKSWKIKVFKSGP